MLLTAKSRSDFIKSLKKTLEFYVNEAFVGNFQNRISSIKTLFQINCNSDKNTKSNKNEELWNEEKPIEFKQPQTLFDELEFSFIKNAVSVKFLIYIAIEQILRIIYQMNEARLLCCELIRGDEVLRAILKETLSFNDFIEFKKGEKNQWIIFPCSNLKDCKIFVSQNFEQVYENQASELMVMLGLISETNLMPIGTYQIKNHREEAEEIPYEISQGNWQFTIEALYDTYKPYEDENLLEIMYNSSLGMVKSLNENHINEIKSNIDYYSNNPHVKKTSLCSSSK